MTHTFILRRVDNATSNLSIPAVVAIASILASAIVLGLPGFSALTEWWQQEEGSHGWVIPLITAFVLWQRRQRVAQAARAGNWWGAVLVAVGLALLIVDTVSQLGRVALPGLVLIAIGSVVAALGWRAARFVTAPLGFLLFAMPPPGVLYVELSLQLQFISSQIGTGLLRLLGVSVFLDGNIIDLGTYQLQVAEACSGLRYLFPLTALTFLCAWMYRAPLWAKGVVLASVVPVTILTNSARIALTGLLVEHGSIAQAEGFMHFFEGWVIFLVALLLVFALMWLLASLRGEAGAFAGLLDVDRLAGAHIPDPAENREGYRRQLLGLPAPLLASVALFVLAVPSQLVLLNRDQVLPKRPGLEAFPLMVGDWQGQPTSIDAETHGLLRATDWLLADFVRAEDNGLINVWIAYFANQVRVAAGHTPKQCLPGAGWEFVSLEAVPAPVPGLTGTPFYLNRAHVTNGRNEMLVYYWLEARGEQFANAQRFKFANLRDSLLDRRSDGALVRLITPLGPGESEAVAEARLVDFMRAAYPALEPHVGR